MLLHDNVPAHSMIRVRQFLAQKMVAVLDHSPYSLIWFLRTSISPLEGAQQGAHFADVNAIKDRLTAIL